MENHGVFDRLFGRYRTSGYGKAPKLLVTLCPTFGHFDKFASDTRLAGIRLNSAMLTPEEVTDELAVAAAKDYPVDLYFDVKGRQMRVEEVLPNEDYLDIRLNHPIKCDTPTLVLFKAGGDRAVVGRLLEGGRRLQFSHNPEFNVKMGESLHIRNANLEILAKPLFSDFEMRRIEAAKAGGVNRWFLSYVEAQADLDEFREIVGDDEVLLKIESKAGLRFIQEEFKKDDKTRLVAACGDLYIELDMPHEILPAMRTIIDADPDAIAGSRMLLSIVKDPVPSYADLAQLAWIQNIGFNTFMLCDELCLSDEQLSTAVNVFDAFKTTLR